MNFSPANIVALITAASFAAGLNLYATILTLGLLARFHWVDLPPGLDSLGHNWVLVACGALFCAEFVADKVPGLDLIWNGLHTFVRIPVAALVAYHASSQLSPSMQIVATAIGAAVALAAHGSKTAVRAAVTPSPEPISNIILSTTEDFAAVGLTWLATHHPILASSLAAALFVFAILVARYLFRTLRHLLSRFRSPERAVELPPPAS